MRLQPTVKRNNGTQNLSSYYEEVVETIEKSSDEDYKMDMLGPRLLQGAPVRFWIGEICKNIGVDEVDWSSSHSLEEQGRVIAQYQLSNELDFINQHTREMYRRRKKLLQEISSGKKSSDNANKTVANFFRPN